MISDNYIELSDEIDEIKEIPSTLVKSETLDKAKEHNRPPLKSNDRDKLHIKPISDFFRSTRNLSSHSSQNPNTVSVKPPSKNPNILKEIITTHSNAPSSAVSYVSKTTTNRSQHSQHSSAIDSKPSFGSIGVQIDNSSKIKHAHEILKTVFRFSHFLPGQLEVISKVFEKRDCFVLLPTGGGKSLCFELPAVVLGGVSVVISPLIALMQNQLERIQSLKINAASYNSTLSKKEKDRIESDLLSPNPHIKILYCAPEMISTPHCKAILNSIYSRNLLSFFAVDEAHCISSWGHSFRSSYRALGLIRVSFSDCPIIALTATATKKVQNDIVSSLKLRNPFIYRTSFDRPNIFYEVLPKPANNVLLPLIDFVSKHSKETGIVYAIRRDDCDLIANVLKQKGFSAEAYHSKLKDSQRESVVARWSRSEVLIVVATIAFGMGIDKHDVRFVIHFDISSSIEAYYQESGRAGRDGKPSHCIVFFSEDDCKTKLFVINQTQKTEHESEEHFQHRVKNAIDHLSEFRDYCVGFNCRRRFLLNYFGEKGEGICKSNCDLCRHGADFVRERFLKNAVTNMKHNGPFHRKRQKIEQTESDEECYDLTNGLMDDEMKCKKTTIEYRKPQTEKSKFADKFIYDRPDVVLERNKGDKIAAMSELFRQFEREDRMKEKHSNNFKSSTSLSTKNRTNSSSPSFRFVKASSILNQNNCANENKNSNSQISFTKASDLSAFKGMADIKAPLNNVKNEHGNSSDLKRNRNTTLNIEKETKGSNQSSGNNRKRLKTEPNEKANKSPSSDSDSAEVSLKDYYQKLRTKAMLYLPQEMKERSNVTNIKDMSYVGRQKAFEKLNLFLLRNHQLFNSSHTDAEIAQKSSVLEYSGFSQSSTKEEYRERIGAILLAIKDANKNGLQFSLDRQETCVCVD